MFRNILEYIKNLHFCIYSKWIDSKEVEDKRNGIITSRKLVQVRVCSICNKKVYRRETIF